MRRSRHESATHTPTASGRWKATVKTTLTIVPRVHPIAEKTMFVVSVKVSMPNGSGMWKVRYPTHSWDAMASFEINWSEV